MATSVSGLCYILYFYIVNLKISYPLNSLCLILLGLILNGFVLFQ